MWYDPRRSIIGNDILCGKSLVMILTSLPIIPTSLVVEGLLMVQSVMGSIPHGAVSHGINPSWCSQSWDQSLMVQSVVGSIPHGVVSHGINPSWCSQSWDQSLSVQSVMGSIPHGDPLSCFLFSASAPQLCNKDNVLLCLWGMVHVKEPLLLIGKCSP